MNTGHHGSASIYKVFEENNLPPAESLFTALRADDQPEAEALFAALRENDHSKMVKLLKAARKETGGEQINFARKFGRLFPARTGQEELFPEKN